MRWPIISNGLLFTIACDNIAIMQLNADRRSASHRSYKMAAILQGHAGGSDCLSPTPSKVNRIQLIRQSSYENIYPKWKFNRYL